MSRKSLLIGITLAILFTISCSFLTGSTTDSPNNQKGVKETGVINVARSSPEAATKGNFEAWASVPYRNVQTQLLTNDDAYATVGITVEFRDTTNSPWVEQEAVVDCRQVGDEWRCDQTFNFQQTAASQATITAQQAATQTNITQEAQIRLTQQAEFDEKCIPEIQPKEESIIHLMEIDFWPEYDRPSMLVIYHVTLSSNLVSLPTDLTFRIPAIAGEPNAVAIQDNSGALMNVEYSRNVRDEWAYISFTTSSPSIRLEYYDPNLVIVDNSRHFEYQWQADYPVDNLVIIVQQPTKARKILISPQMYGPGLLEDGMNYYCTNLGTTKNQSTSLITIDYEIEDTH